MRVAAREERKSSSGLRPWLSFLPQRSNSDRGDWFREKSPASGPKRGCRLLDIRGRCGLPRQDNLGRRESVTPARNESPAEAGQGLSWDENQEQDVTH
jgi:hypothetical protein